MDQPYSVVADWLSKFHTWPGLIQVLWLIMMPLTLLSMTWLVMRGIRDILHAVQSDKDCRSDGVYRDAQGRIVIGREWPQEIERQSRPELIGRELRLFRRPEK